MRSSSKITELALLDALHEIELGRGSWKLPGALKLTNPRRAPSSACIGGDAVVEIGPNDENRHLFVIEAKSRNTPEAIETAIVQAKNAISSNPWPNGILHPMVYVPYLSTERLDHLEQKGVSGMDACGNAVVIVPGKLYVRRDGNPNRYRDDRDLNNPFSGLSAMVGRMLLLRKEFGSLNQLHQTINGEGVRISLSQVSKAVKALAEERILRKARQGIRLIDPLRLLDQLALGWKTAPGSPTHACNLKPGTPLAEILDSLVKDMPNGPICRWAVTGESSVGRYASFSEAGPRKIAVSNLGVTLQALHPRMMEPKARNFADVIFIQTCEYGYYFHNEVDHQGFRWADPLQTWLEMQAGDARQRDVANDLRQLILKNQNLG